MCVFVLYYKVATPRQLLNEQHVLGLTRDIFTVSPSPSSPSPAAAAPCACSAASAGVFAGSHCGSFFFAVAFRLLYCIGACRMEIENCS